MDGLEVRLPNETVLTFSSQDGRVEIDLKQPDFHRHYLIENRKGYEIHKNQRFELDVDKIDEIIDVICELIDTTESVAGANLFDVILWDLVDEKQLDWISDGIHYFDGRIFFVFQSEENFKQYLQGEDVDRSEYQFPFVATDYDLKKAFDEDFIDY